MTERETLNSQIEANSIEIERLRAESNQFTKDLLLVSDEEQWFLEKEEVREISRNPNVFEMATIGRIHWTEFFMNKEFPEDEEQGVEIERSRIVRVNGEWV